MASLLSTYMQKEQQLKALQDELEKLENDERLKQEIEFKEALEKLMQEFDKTASDVIEILTPGKGNTSSQQASSGRRKRKLKIYKNPETGEVIETRGGNQKTLKAWKDEHGSETVETWLVRTED